MAQSIIMLIDGVSLSTVVFCLLHNEDWIGTRLSKENNTDSESVVSNQSSHLVYNGSQKLEYSNFYVTIFMWYVYFQICQNLSFRVIL